MSEAKEGYKLGKQKYIDENGDMIRPVRCKICPEHNNFAKQCELCYENQYYGYAQEFKSKKSIYFYHGGFTYPDFGTEFIHEDGDTVRKGIRGDEDYNNLFKLATKPLNGKVITPREGDFIAGIVQKNTVGKHKGKLQWVKWYKQSLTCYNFVMCVKQGIESHAMRTLIDKPMMLMASMVRFYFFLREGFFFQKFLPFLSSPTRRFMY